VSGHPSNPGLGRALAARRQVQTAAVWRAASNGSGMALHTASIAALIYVPSGAPLLEALAELGGARATCIGELPQGADVLEGDELRAGGKTYIVERAIARATLTWCALSEVRNP
jgi:hypothetical protein